MRCNAGMIRLRRKAFFFDQRDCGFQPGVGDEEVNLGLEGDIPASKSGAILPKESQPRHGDLGGECLDFRNPMP
jgi:hypothetical protein